MAAVVGDVAVRVGADISPLNKGLKDGSRSVGKFSKDLKSGASSAAKYTAALALVATTGLALIITETAQAAKETKNFAKIANSSVEVFQRMAFGARSVGIEQDKFSDIIKDVNERVGDFITTGAGPMKDFFDKIGPKIGVTIDQFKRLSGPEALQFFHDSLEKANLTQQETSFFLESMASDATALIPLLKNGGKGFADLAKEADKFNIVLSDADINNLAQGQKSFDNMGNAIKGATNEISQLLLPELGKVEKAFTKIVSKVTEMVKGIRDAREESRKQAEEQKQIAELGGVISTSISHTNRMKEKTLTVEQEINKLLSVQLGLENSIANPVTQNARGRKFSADQIAKTLAWEKEVLAANTARIELLRTESEEAEKIFQIKTKTKAVDETPKAEPVKAESFGPDISQEELDKRRLAAETELEEIKARYLLKEELERIHREEMAIIGMEFDQSKFNSESEWMTVREAAEKDHAKKLEEIKKASMSKIEKFNDMSWQNQVKSVSGSLMQMTAGVAQHSKAMFKVNKAAGIANAIVNTAQGVTTALANYPPPISFVMAAAQAAAGFAQISAIKSQSFNGGGRGPSPAAAANVPTTTTQAQQPSSPEPTRMYVDNLDVHSILSGRTVIDIINRAQADGAVLSVGGRS